MNPMKSFLFRWLVTTLAVMVAVPLAGIRADGLVALCAASLLLGVVNAVIRPILLLLSLPLILFTMGFFILVVNALTLAIVGGLVPGFDVPGFGSAFFGALIISVVSWLLNGLSRGSDGRVRTVASSPRLKTVQGRVIE
jgi:putative membrane protein